MGYILMSANIDMNQDKRIISNPGICHGNPVIRGTRVMVWLILEYLANGDSIDDILAAYPCLTREDILACLSYAAKAARGKAVPVENSVHGTPVTEYEEILDRASHLDSQSQISLLTDLAALVRDGGNRRKQHDITEFQGITKGLWADVGVEEYIKQERDSWED